jgi:hypothetical protein
MGGGVGEADPIIKEKTPKILAGPFPPPTIHANNVIYTTDMPQN